MKSCFSVFLIVLAFSFLNRDICAQGDGLPNLDGLNSQGSKMDPWYLPEWGHVPYLTPGTASGPPTREARVLKKGILAPSVSDQTALVGFLRMPNTGLIRLLPREGSDSETTHAKSPVNIRGGGAYYSFASLTHVYGYGSDIELSQQTFSVGFAGADYGMITMLGDVPLDQVSVKDSRAQLLLSYQPPLPEHFARAEARRFQFRGGVTINGLNYQSRQPAFAHWTYLLRSISYDRSDVLVAFKVLRKDADGGVTIAWKLLKKYPTPELK